MLRIIDLLPEGRKNAVSSRDLARLAGFSSVRALQRAIARERRREVILSTCGLGGGNFRPASDYEVLRFVRTVESRIKNSEAALKSAKAALEKRQKETALGDCSTQDGRLANDQPIT